MRAEIDVTNLSPEEAATMTVRVASPEAYRAAGVEYNIVLSGAQVTVARRTDGRPYLRVASDRAVQEPFLEVILELSWASGRLVREYTLLFDPPGSRMAPAAQAAAPVAPVMSGAPAAQPGRAPATIVAAAPAAAPAPAPAPAAMPAPAARPRAAAPAAPPPVPAPAPPPPAAAPAPAPKPPAPAPAAAREPAPTKAEAKPASSGGVAAGRYTVKRGDTLYGIAKDHLGSSEAVSLDQMLVGLYRANPDAFMKSNMNRMKAGAVLSLPDAGAVQGIEAGEARRVIVAQSQDFGAYRSRLAQGAPEAQTEASGRQATGKVQADVNDRKQSAAPTPDRLKLSGAAVKASSPEAQVAQAAERKDAAARVAELSRNVEDLKKIQQGSPAAPGAAAPLPAPAAAPVPAPSAAPPLPTPPPAAAPVAAVASAAIEIPVLAPPMMPSVAPAPMAASMPEAVAASGAEPMLMPPVTTDGTKPSFMDSLTSSPWLLPGAGILALLLAALGAWRLRGRMQKSASETSFLESRMQPDSFFGASGGQRVDTRDAATSASSSMGYSLSQIDAIGDVDPVAEADVYLAYGRDLQAEEILKEAMRATPDRLAVRTKLLEVYAKRRDTKGFELLATQLYALTNGAGTEWSRAQEMGLQIDPENQLYQAGGHPEEMILDGERVVVEPLSATTLPHEMSVMPPAAPIVARGAPALDDDPDLNLDLDLSDDTASQGLDATQPMAPGGRVNPAAGASYPFAETAPQPPASRLGRNGPDTRLGEDRTVRADLDPMSLDLSDDEPATEADRGGKSLAFDQFALSKPGDLDDGTTTPSQLDDLGDDGDPMARKLELAEEFRQIGDIEGARDLISEVVGKSDGVLKAKAQAMLDALG